MIDCFYNDPEAAERLRAGPLAPHLDSFASELAERGYAEISARQKLLLVADLSRWLARRRLGVGQLDENRVKQFLAHRKRRGSGGVRSRTATMRQLLAHLREGEAIPAKELHADDSIVGNIQCEYAKFLLHERGLAETSVVNYLSEVHRFLSDYARRARGQMDFGKLRQKHVNRYVIRYAENASRRRAQLMTTVLRSFFRFLHLRGEIEGDLAGCVPTVPAWRLSTVPKFLPPEEVERILESCDQRTVSGRRDHAILLLLARLGLRAGEVASMALEDIDWEGGEINVQGSKRTGEEGLPIPDDVGVALVRYLRDRPRCKTRRIFVRVRAPYQGFSSSVAICNVVHRALARCELHPTLKGAHLLRHSLATTMLRSGSSLAEIGDVLRHRGPDTTQIYAKCDVEGLRQLAQPWPRSPA